jgi:LTXXQ motif family protein
VLEALRSWKYAKAQPTAAVRRAQSRSAVRLVLTTSAFVTAMLLLVVSLLTLEADARGGGGGGHGGGGRGGFGGHGGGGHFGGFGGHGGGHGFGGHGGGGHFGGFGGHRGGISFGARGGGRSFRAAHIGRAHIGRAHVGRAHIAGRSIGSSRSQRAGVAAARLGGAGNRFAAASAHTLGGAAARMGDPGRRVFGNRAIANVALQSQFGQARFHGAFFGSAWPWWRGGLVLGWFGPLFWPYAYYDLFDYVYWPYAYDDFWPYAYDDVYYGIYGPYAYGGRYGYRSYAGPNGYYGGRSARRGVSAGRYAARSNGPERRAAEVCSDDATQLTYWPIERISEIVQPTAAQRPALDELRAASAKAIDMLKSGCPKDLPSIPTGRLAAMESRLQVMLAAVQTVRPALERFYQSLSDEQKARFNAIAPADDRGAAAKDQRDLTKLCDERAPGVTDLPIDRIAQVVQPTPAQRVALDELKDASVKAAERLETDCQ